MRCGRIRKGLSAALWAAILGAWLMWTADADAIPAFARKYRLSCSTCHAPVPRLKPYGDDFAANGFKLEDKEPVRAFFDTGDELLTLQRELPLAIRFDGYASLQSKKLGRASDFQWPYYLKILSGGQVAHNVGYYLYFLMNERGEIAGIEDAYLYFNNLLGADLDILVGQFQVSDPLFKRELRITLEDYQIYKVKVGPTPSDLTYDRGITVAYGAPFGLDLVLEVVNGNGIGPAETARAFDSDNKKNFMLRVSQSIGPLRLGGFGYRGEAAVRDSVNAVNRFHYLGIDATADVMDKLQLNTQFLVRRDDNPLFLASGAERVTTKGGFVEAIWAIRGPAGRPFLTFLYNWVDPPSGFSELKYRSATVNLSYLLRRNLRLAGEVTYDLEAKATRAAVGFVSGF
jgi:hypothetical protein